MKKYIYVYKNDRKAIDILIVFDEIDYMYSFVHPKILKGCMLDCICNKGDKVVYLKFSEVSDSVQLKGLIKKYEDMFK